jgi:hypothetical protein
VRRRTRAREQRHHLLKEDEKVRMLPNAHPNTMSFTLLLNIKVENGRRDSPELIACGRSCGSSRCLGRGRRYSGGPCRRPYSRRTHRCRAASGGGCTRQTLAVVCTEGLSVNVVTNLKLLTFVERRACIASGAGSRSTPRSM